jgi:hypothetical protein
VAPPTGEGLTAPPSCISGEGARAATCPVADFVLPILGAALVSLLACLSSNVGVGSPPLVLKVQSYGEGTTRKRVGAGRA